MEEVRVVSELNRSIRGLIGGGNGKREASVSLYWLSLLLGVLTLKLLLDLALYARVGSTPFIETVV